MIENYTTDVKKDGTILLGPLISCDGFDCRRKIRVQTHTHYDHMKGFNQSKAYQKKIIMSYATKDLLIEERNAELPYRNNIITQEYFKPMNFKGFQIEICPSDHMLGSVQTRVTFPDGYRVVYSSDFNWPISQGVFECDELVVDATYGTPGRQLWTKEEVIKLLLERVAEKIAEKGVIIQGFRGRIEHVMEILGNYFPNVPLISSQKLYNNAKVYRSYGYNIRELMLDTDTDAVKLFKDKKPFLAFFDLFESDRIPESGIYKIYLSSHLCYEEPILDYNENWCKIALTNHTDFDGTINYIKASKCSRVVTDSSRGGNGQELAYHIRNILGIEARPATLLSSKEWGI